MSQAQAEPAPALWTEDQVKQFYPTVVYESTTTSIYALALIELPLCPCCQRPMLCGSSGLFPRWMMADGDVQAKRAGWVRQSPVKDAKDHPICTECAAADKVRFRCALCEAELPASAVQETIGSDWPDYLCKQCYQTVPAARWCAKVEELEHAHRYDSAL